MSSILNKRVKSNREYPDNHVPSINSLPRDLLVEMIATIASQSFLDLQNMKTCCKDFLEASEDTYVFQKVSLDKFPLIQWFPNEKELSLLKRCRESENTESLFREGLIKFFGYPKGNIVGLESLKMAVQKGHKEARYVYGMILLCCKDNKSRKEGLKHMRILRNSKCVMNCRKKVEYLSCCMWKNNGMLGPNQTCICKSKNTCKGWRVKKGRWKLLEDDDDDLNMCEYCRWDHELNFFYQLFTNNI